MSASSLRLAVLIDDNDIDLFVQKRFIEINKFAEQVITFRSPLDALDYFAKGQDLPEMIFLDLNMPVMDGFEFLEKYLELPEHIISVPKVVVLTSSSSALDRDKAGSYTNVLGFISKPMSIKSLEALRESFFASMARELTPVKEKSQG